MRNIGETIDISGGDILLADTVYKVIGSLLLSLSYLRILIIAYRISPRCPCDVGMSVSVVYRPHCDDDVAYRENPDTAVSQ